MVFWPLLMLLGAPIAIYLHRRRSWSKLRAIAAGAVIIYIIMVIVGILVEM
jgi:hypothetical protein